ACPTHRRARESIRAADGKNSYARRVFSSRRRPAAAAPPELAGAGGGGNHNAQAWSVLCRRPGGAVPPLTQALKRGNPMTYDKDAVADRTCVRFTMHFPDGPRQ